MFLSSFAIVLIPLSLLIAILRRLQGACAGRQGPAPHDDPGRRPLPPGGARRGARDDRRRFRTLVVGSTALLCFAKHAAEYGGSERDVDRLSGAKRCQRVPGRPELQALESSAAWSWRARPDLGGAARAPGLLVVNGADLGGAKDVGLLVVNGGSENLQARGNQRRSRVDLS